MEDSLSPERARELVDAEMSALFERRRHEALTISGSYGTFWSHIADVANAGGKRVRPYLTMVGNGAIDERVLPIAVAQEIIHIAMLMHDDIIDQATTRHGTNNVTGFYLDTYRAHTDEARALHYANSVALLAGDALVSEAYQLIHTSSYPDAIKQKLSTQLATSIFEVIGGQLLDIEAGFITTATFDPLTVYRYKTSSYSFIGPLLSGAYCSDTDEATLATLERFATNIGIAFQIQDDLLGVFGDESETGKSTVVDLQEGKQTILAQYHREAMNQEQKERFAWFGNMQTSDEQLRTMKQDMIDSGARQKTVELATRYFSAAKNDLIHLPDDARTTELTRLVTRLEGRKK